MRTGIVFDPVYLSHEQSPTHPERRERLSYTIDQLVEEGIFDHPDITLISPRPASRQEVLAVHAESYLKQLEELSRTGGILDMDTSVPPGLISGALLAAGGAITGGEAVISGHVKNAFVLCRPPGHHAGIANGAGFCYLNNIAIMVRYLRRSGLKRIMILDWDAHHGNGTEEIFYEDNSVLFCSIHQYPFYPGSGRVEEIGRGPGRGYTVNMPVPAGSSDRVYHFLLEKIIIPLAEEFSPDLIAISAGQDNHFSDPLTGLALTAHGYASLMREICILAEEWCGGRVVAVLEGGYSVEGGLPYTNLGIVAAMAGLPLDAIREPDIYLPLLDRARSEKVMPAVIRMASDLTTGLKPYWACF